MPRSSEMPNQPDSSSCLAKRGGRYHLGAANRQRALRLAGKLGKYTLGAQKPEYGIPKKLKPLVVTHVRIVHPA